MATQGNWGGSWDGEWFGATEATDFRSAVLAGQGSVTATATAIGSMSANLAGQSDLVGLISVTDTGLVASIAGSGSLQATISYTGEAVGDPGGGGSGGGRASPSDWSASRRARLADDEAAQEMIRKLFAQAQEEDQIVLAILETMMEDM